MQKIKEFWKNLLGELSIDDKSFRFMYLKCFVIFVIQILSFIYKPVIFIGLILILYCILFEEFDNKLYYLFFLLPFYNVFRMGTNNAQASEIVANFGNTYFSIFAFMAFVIIFAIKFIVDLKNKKKKVNIKFTILYALLYLLIIIPIHQLSSIAISNFCVITGLFVSVYFIYIYKEKFDLKKIVSIWFFAILLTIITFCLRNLLPELKSYITFSHLRYSFLQRDPNYLGLELLMILSVATVLFLDKKINVIYFLILITNSILIVFAASKACFLILILYYIIFALTLLIKSIKDVKHHQMTKKKFFIGLVIVLVAVGCACLLMIKRKMFIIDRFQEFLNLHGTLRQKLNTLTTGRSEIWIEYLKYFTSSVMMILFGRGAVNGYQFSAIHNTLVQLLYFGGAILLVLLIVSLVAFAVKHKMTKSRFVFIPVFVFICVSLSLDLLFSYRTYLMLTLFILMYNLKNTDKGIEQND